MIFDGSRQGGTNSRCRSRFAVWVIWVPPSAPPQSTSGRVCALRRHIAAVPRQSWTASPVPSPVQGGREELLLPCAGFLRRVWTLRGGESRWGILCREKNGETRIGKTLMPGRSFSRRPVSSGLRCPHPASGPTTRPRSGSNRRGNSRRSVRPCRPPVRTRRGPRSTA